MTRELWTWALGTWALGTWALWLAIPVAVTALAAIWSWVRSRPAPTPSTDESMRAHEDYLAALAEPARGSARVEPGSETVGGGVRDHPERRAG